MLRNIHYRLGYQSILNNISWDIEPGRITAVVGPNGAGKSTLLKILSGELLPTEGEILLHDRPLVHWSTVQLARMRSVLPQSFELSFDFTVAEVVSMGRMPHTIRSQTQTNPRICAEALQQVGMQDFAERLYTTLSGGEKQRVQLARVLAQVWPEASHPEPRYLFLDEPTSNLDLHQKHTILSIARKFMHNHIGSVVVLHDLNLALKYADTAILINAGEMVEAGNVMDVLTAANIERIFHMRATFLDNPYDAQRPWLVTAPR